MKFIQYLGVICSRACEGRNIDYCSTVSFPCYLCMQVGRDLVPAHMLVLSFCSLKSDSVLTSPNNVKGKKASSFP